MKNLLLLLVLANILYFLWGKYQVEPPAPGSVIVNETATLTPPLPPQIRVMTAPVVAQTSRPETIALRWPDR